MQMREGVSEEKQKRNSLRNDLLYGNRRHRSLAPLWFNKCTRLAQRRA